MDSNNLLISIIVPVYNAKDYLTDCVNHLIGQTYRNIEILLIDDGSSDGTGVLCDKIAETDSRIKVFHKENGGTHTARNLGIEVSQGEYLMFIDPDDWYDFEAIEYLVNHIQKENLDLIRFSYIKEYENFSEKRENTFIAEKVYENDECLNLCRRTIGLLSEELCHPENLNFLASVCFCVYRKSVIKENSLSFYNIRTIGTFSDGLFNINYLLYAKKMEYVNKYFYHYRKTNSASATSNYRENFLEKQLILFAEIDKIVKEQGKEFEEALSNRIALSSMEMCLNVFKSSKKATDKYTEIKEVLNNPIYKNAYKNFDISYLPLKWKIYYFFIMARFIPGVYLMTRIIMFLKKRGV